MGVRQNEKTGHWEVDFRDQHRKRIQKTFKRKKDADDYYEESHQAARQGRFIRPSDKTIGDVADQWIERKRSLKTYAFKTLQNWQIHIDNYIKAQYDTVKGRFSLGSLRIQAATIKDMEDASLLWVAQTSANQAKMVLKTASAIFAMAQRQGILEPNGVNVAHAAERPKVAIEDEDDGELLPEDVWTEEDMSKLVSATEPGTVERILIWLGGFCGLRIGEILGFSWPAIDLKAANPKISVLRSLVSAKKEESDFPGYGETGRTLKHPKSKKSRRSIDAPRELVHDLRLWKLKCPQGRPQEWPKGDPLAKQIVMATIEGKPLQTSAAQDMLDAACERAQVERRTLHRLRHTFASLLLQRGETLIDVSRLLGHRDIGITAKVYAHFIERRTTAVQDLASSVLGRTK
jgi:integrase